MTDRSPTTPPPRSWVHGLLSFVVPGSGQISARQPIRGIAILLSFLGLAALAAWTVAQRSRTPDVLLSARLFGVIFAQALALLLFLAALRYVVARFAKGEPASALWGLILAAAYIASLLLVQDQLLAAAGAPADLDQIYGGTALFAAGALTAFLLWNVADAALLGAHPDARPSFAAGILYVCLVIFVLGWNLTEIDVQKAVAEYRDTQIILRRIVWPWRAAFEYEQVTIESSARIQAPCPPGATGPEVNQPVPGVPWISVTPTCGDISLRDLAAGKLIFGTELTITGGGYPPGSEVDLLWKNPIGNAFKPRGGVGDTEITIDENGEFVSTLYIPEVAIPSTAVGDQIHTIIIRQESGEIFTGRLSPSIKLALTGMLETIMIGLMATFFGVIAAFPISFFAARNLMAPIKSPLTGVVGGLVGLALALVLTFWATGRVSVSLGGLAAAPIQVAGFGLALLLVSAYFGWNSGAALATRLGKTLPPAVTRGLTALEVAALAGAAGYLLGVWFSRGVVSIPLAGPVPSFLEQRYAFGGAALFGLAGFLYGYRNALKEFSLGLTIYSTTRTLMNIVRSIEPLIWAIIGTIWIGLGPFAGTIALTLHTIASLGKLYSEAIESIEPGPLEALQATGANRLQTIVYAVIPQIVPSCISFTIYRWDINVRMSTIIGAVGGGGIGFILIQWIRLFQYDNVGLAVWLITLTVATLDYVSSSIRERFI